MFPPWRFSSWPQARLWWGDSEVADRSSVAVRGVETCVIAVDVAVHCHCTRVVLMDHRRLKKKVKFCSQREEEREDWRCITVLSVLLASQTDKSFFIWKEKLLPAITRRHFLSRNFLDYNLWFPPFKLVLEVGCTVWNFNWCLCEVRELKGERKGDDISRSL